MSDAPVDIPNRALFKAAEVCEIARLQPYVLRSWETEFPELGVQKAGNGGRVYRRADVERVLRIKHLLLVDGLTLAGVRRKLEAEAAPVSDEVPLDDLFGRNARERIVGVKNSLRSLLDLLGSAPTRTVPARPVARGLQPARTDAGDYELTPPPPAVRSRPMAERAQAAAAKFGASRKAASKPSRTAKRAQKPAKTAGRRGRRAVN